MEEHVIYQYTRKQAIADGVLIDVSEMARKCGMACPIAVTAAVWDQYIEGPHEVDDVQTADSRLGNILHRLCLAAVASRNEEQLLFECDMGSSLRDLKTIRLKAVCGPDDDFKPVLTIMLPTED